jgi:undecaprenyl-diphosphatase
MLTAFDLPSHTSMNAFDIQLFLWLNATADSAPWLLSTARWITEYVSAAALIALLPMAVMHRRTRWQVLGVLLTMLFAWLAARGMREWIPSSRPFVMGIGFQGLPHGGSAGFPSMHATMAGAWAAGLCAFAHPHQRWAWGAVVAPVAASIAWSRVYLGLHFPSDVAMGLMVSAVCAVLAHALMQRSPWTRAVRERLLR